jgi:hypothetical protein
MSTYTVMRENFVANRWDHVALVDAPSPERAVKHALAAATDVFGTYVAIPTDDWTQFMQGRERIVVSAHIETLQPA